MTGNEVHCGARADHTARKYFQSSHGICTSRGGRSELPSRFLFRVSSERKYDREYDDEYAGTDHSDYLPIVVATGLLRQKPPRSEQRSASDCHRPDYRFDHVDDERLEREREDGQRHTDRRTNRSERPVRLRLRRGPVIGVDAMAYDNLSDRKSRQYSVSQLDDGASAIYFEYVSGGDEAETDEYSAADPSAGNSSRVWSGEHAVDPISARAH